MDADFDSGGSSDYSLLGRMYKTRSLPGVNCVQDPDDDEVSSYFFLLFSKYLNVIHVSIIVFTHSSTGCSVSGGRAWMGQWGGERLLPRAGDGQRRGDRGRVRQRGERRPGKRGAGEVRVHV